MSIVSLVLSCLSFIIIVVIGVCLYNVYKDYKHNKKVIDDFKTIVDKIVNEKLLDMCVDVKNNKVDGSIDIDSGSLTKLKEYFDNKIDSVVDELEKQIDNVDDFYYIKVDE